MAFSKAVATSFRLFEAAILRSRTLLLSQLFKGNVKGSLREIVIEGNRFKGILIDVNMKIVLKLAKIL